MIYQTAVLAVLLGAANAQLFVADEAQQVCFYLSAVDFH